MRVRGTLFSYFSLLTYRTCFFSFHILYCTKGPNQISAYEKLYGDKHYSSESIKSIAEACIWMICRNGLQRSEDLVPHLATKHTQLECKCWHSIDIRSHWINHYHYCAINKTTFSGRDESDRKLQNFEFFFLHWEGNSFINTQCRMFCCCWRDSKSSKWGALLKLMKIIIVW